MPGRLVETLNASWLASVLTGVEIRTLAAVGALRLYQTGAIPGADEQNRNIYILRQGQVALHISMPTDGGQCGGDVTLHLTARGDVFGWAAWVRPERIAVSAVAEEPTSLVVLDLDRLRQSPLYWKVSQWMVYRLFALMQEAGLCPPNIQGLLELRDMHVWTDTVEADLAASRSYDQESMIEARSGEQE